MITRIKSWLRQRLFATDELVLQARKEALEAQYTNIDIVNLTREQLKGYQMRPISALNIAISEITEGMSETQRNDYYTAAHELYENETLQMICNFLVQKQVMNIALQAHNIEEVNFNRASINGLSLIWDELKAAEGIFQKANQPEEDFNKFSIT